MYVLAQNNVVVVYPYSITQLKKDNPQTSFPSSITEQLLAFYNVFAVLPTQIPDYNPLTHNVQELNPILQDGEWIQTWEVTAANEQEVNERLQSLSNAIRYDRDQKLAESDWIVARSYEQQTTVPVSWSTYRQALRDITTQSGFPINIVWPVKPSI